MNFFQNIRNSIYSPSFYKTIPQKTFGQSIKYFFLLILFLLCVQLIFLFHDLVIQAPKELQLFIQETISCFPDDLQIKIAKGEVATNVEEPYVISPSSSCGKNFYEVGDENHNNFAVIDTKTPFSQTKFEEYNSYIWLTKDAVVVKDKDYQTRLYSLTDVENFNLDKKTIDSVYNKFSPFLNFVGPVLLIFVFLGLFIVYIFRLLQFLITASLIWLLGKMFQKPVSFSSSYKLTIFAATLGLIADLIINITDKWTKFHGFPFMFTALTLGVVTVNFFLTAKKNESKD